MFDLLTRLFYIIFLPRLSYLTVRVFLSLSVSHTHTHIGTRSTRTFLTKSLGRTFIIAHWLLMILHFETALFIVYFTLSHSSELPQDVPVISSVDSWTSFPTVIALFLTTSPSTVTRIYRSAARTALPVPWSRSSSSRKRRMTGKILEKAYRLAIETTTTSWTTVHAARSMCLMINSSSKPFTCSRCSLSLQLGSSTRSFWLTAREIRTPNSVERMVS